MTPMSAITLDSSLARAIRTTQSWRRRVTARPRAVRVIVDTVDWLMRAVSHVRRNRRYLTVTKLANIAVINLQFAMKRERVIGLPYRMKIESTNICNTNCQLCPTGQGLAGRAKGKMSRERYERLIDQLGRYLYALDLSMWGDPLIVPDIYHMIRYAHDRGIWTYVSSNLHALKPEKGQCEALVRSGLDVLTVSLHGATQGTFAIYQPGKDFEATVEKLRSILAARRRLKSTTPAIQLNFVVTRHNEHEVERFGAFADELGCKTVFSNPSLNTRFLDRDEDLEPLELTKAALTERTAAHLDQWLPRDERYVVEPYKLMRRYGQILWMSDDQAAFCFSPSVNVIPAITS
ncbi:MAG: hypothetical protein CMJ49_10155 [Planctomycetaceae bacterium]|nr:hypothetical protein [Planctomycetaceae bacterium]